jgi:hypothetical protein
MNDGCVRSKSFTTNRSAWIVFLEQCHCAVSGILKNLFDDDFDRHFSKSEILP